MDDANDDEADEVTLPDSQYVCSECWSAAQSLQAPCPACGSNRVVVTDVLRKLLAS